LKLLLDTHALLWALSLPQQLSSTARNAIEDPANELWVSSVSFFEISTKVRLAKLSTPGSLLSQWEWTMARLGARVFSLGPAAAILAGELVWDHRDPFDRLLVAQARLEQAVLVSADSQLQSFPGLNYLW
jgi:PIN domain nuclease of toxin-antitoxin system